MHLGAHQQRLKTDGNHKVVMHAHPTNLISMTHVHEIDEIKFTKTLWGMCTECIVIFPDGVSVLPWMVSSSDNLGLVSSEKFRDFRVLVWALHGMTVTGNSLDEAFGLMETVEKAADIYMHIVNCNVKSSITDDMLRQICKDFHLEVKEGWL
jgi:rhamnulose-1-phosphate aldolase